MKKDLVVLLSRFPYPLDKGDKLRAFYQIKYLSKSFRIHLICLSDIPVKDTDIQQLEEYCETISIHRIRIGSIFLNLIRCLFNGKPFQVGYYYNTSIMRKIRKQIDRIAPHALYCQLARMASYALSYSGHKVLDYQDAFSLNYRRIASQSTGMQRLFFSWECRRMQKFEKKIYTEFPFSTIISETDKESIGKPLEKLFVVKNGIDTIKFSSIKNKTHTTTDILFVGNLSYLPNVEAVKYLVYKLLPLLLPKFPDIKITLIGPSTKKEILSIKHPNVVYKGWVDNVVNEYRQAKIFVAPLFVGAGLQNKLLEAMSMQLAAVTTPIVNQSLEATPNQHLLLANNEAEFLAQISKLLQDEAYRTKMEQAARQFVESQYSWEKEVDKLKDLLMN